MNGVPYQERSAIFAQKVSGDIWCCKWLIVNLPQENARSTSTDEACVV
jgi:hypothetical protein